MVIVNVDRGEWWNNDGARVLPDVTPGSAPWCPAEHRPSGYGCTRRLGHTGRHAAGDSFQVVAVWR